MDHKPAHVQRALSGRLDNFSKSRVDTDDQAEFYPSQYYYNRDEHTGVGGATSFGSLANVNASRNDIPSHGPHQAGMASFGGMNGGYTFQHRQQQQHRGAPQLGGMHAQMPPSYGAQAVGAGGGDLLSMLNKGLHNPQAAPGPADPMGQQQPHKMGSAAGLSSDFQSLVSGVGGPGMASSLGGSSNRGAPFDMSDFPALAGGSLSMNRGSSEPPSYQAPVSGHHYGQSATDSSITLGDRMHQTLSHQQRRDYDSRSHMTTTPRTGAFAMQSVDFPALPGSSSLLNDQDSPSPQQMQILQIGKGPGIVDDLRGGPGGNHHHQSEAAESLLASLNTSAQGGGKAAPSPAVAQSDLRSLLTASGSATADHTPQFSLEGANAIAARQQPSVFGALGTSSSPGGHRQVDNTQQQAAPGGPAGSVALQQSSLAHVRGSGVSRPGDIQPPGTSSAAASSSGSQAQQQVTTVGQQQQQVQQHQIQQQKQQHKANAGTAGGSATGASHQQPQQQTDAEKQARFGLLGLLDVIRMTNADLNTLALGSDLTTLGLNLNSSENLYATFASPWAEAPTSREPQFSLPLCYYMQPPPLKTSHLAKFQLETLFYVFYAMPKDVLQAYAAQELYNREWQYHQDLKLWFKRGSPADGLAVNSNQFIYFDINSWECRIFGGGVAQPGGVTGQQQPNPTHATVASSHQISSTSTNSNLAAGLLHENDVRVKFTAHASGSSSS